MKQTIQLHTAPLSHFATVADGSAINAPPSQFSSVVPLPNDVDPRGLNLEGVSRIDLHFPKFTDGRAYSQAFLLRRRMQFKGEIRATGDVLVDQLVQMQRSGFDAAELRADQVLGHARAQFGQFDVYYQGDAVKQAPHFQGQAS